MSEESICLLHTSFSLNEFFSQAFISAQRHLLPISKTGSQPAPHLLLQPGFVRAVLGDFTWHLSWWQQALQPAARD